MHIKHVRSKGRLTSSESETFLWCLTFFLQILPVVLWSFFASVFTFIQCERALKTHSHLWFITWFRLLLFIYNIAYQRSCRKVIFSQVSFCPRGLGYLWWQIPSCRIPDRTEKPAKPGKMGRHFPVREKSGNFEQTGLPTPSESEKDQRTIGRDQRTNGKHQRKFSRLLSLGLNTALHLAPAMGLPVCIHT